MNTRTAVQARERRQASPSEAADLRARLNPAQAATLRTLEQFQWTLKFVRRPPFQEPLAVVVDRSGQRHAVLEADGSINEAAGLRLRD